MLLFFLARSNAIALTVNNTDLGPNGEHGQSLYSPIQEVTVNKQ